MGDFVDGPLVRSREIFGLLADDQRQNDADDRRDDKINRAVSASVNGDAVSEAGQQKRRHRQADRRDQPRSARSRD